MDPFYLIRLDDACPTMDVQRWSTVEDILDKYNIKPLVGVIPKNNDQDLVINKDDIQFWTKVHKWQKKEWIIALHGYDHVCLTKSGGINPIHKRSEFAGLSLSEQEKKIEMGLRIFEEHNIEVSYFYAPSHTFDKNTIYALLNKSRIRNISDTIAFKPYKMHSIIFYPQQFGYFRNIKLPGYWTFCYHPNNMDENMLDNFESFIQKNLKRFISFNQINLNNLRERSFFDKLYGLLYFFLKRINAI